MRLARSSVLQTESTVGNLESVACTVTVNSKRMVSKGIDGLKFFDGDIVSVASVGKTTLVFDNGCSITLERNQQLEVDSGKRCELLIASVKSPVAAVAKGLLMVGVPANNLAVAGFGLGAGLLTLSANNSKTSGS